MDPEYIAHYLWIQPCMNEKTLAGNILASCAGTDNFISRVSEGRKMSKANVDSIAQGRVWTGVDAKRIGLVDEFGGLETAIQIAAKRAKITSYRIQELPFKEDPFKKFIKQLSGDTEDEVLHRVLGESYVYYNQLNHLRRMQNYQTRLPYQIEVY
jgi:protease-4